MIPQVNRLSQVSSFLFRAADYLPRLRNLLRRTKIMNFSVTGHSEGSDSQETFYVEAVRKINTDSRKFKDFRRYFDYREILEHVTYNQGLLYINRIRQLDKTILNDMDKFKTNDLVGNPRRYTFYNFGRFSPTTIRYISVATELKVIFQNRIPERVIEIGAGYGGQYLVLQEFFKISEYSIFDLPEVQQLISNYLQKSFLLNNVKFVELESFHTENNSLVISNYAFSELPRKLQIDYIEKVLGKCKFGYLIMNSGISNQTGRSAGKLSLEELKGLLPPFEILDEIPSTGPDNYVIVWGHKE